MRRSLRSGSQLGQDACKDRDERSHRGKARTAPYLVWSHRLRRRKPRPGTGRHRPKVTLRP